MSIIACIDAFNRALTGVVTEYSDPSLNQLLAQGEKYLYELRIMQAAGTGTPTITVKVERSNDNLNWNDKATIFTLANFANGVQWAQDTGSNVGGCFARISVALTGTNPSAQLQLIITIRED